MILRFQVFVDPKYLEGTCVKAVPDKNRPEKTVKEHIVLLLISPQYASDQSGGTAIRHAPIMTIEYVKIAPNQEEHYPNCLGIMRIAMASPIFSTFSCSMFCCLNPDFFVKFPPSCCFFQPIFRS